jgi:hypothetical protein
MKKKEVISTQQSSIEDQQEEAVTTKKEEIRRMEQEKKDTKRRTPCGLSYASCNPKKIGAKPTTCKGCNKVIQYDVARISNHFKLKNQLYPITHQYHCCNASCLKRLMDKETIKRLVEKRWPQKDMENIVEKLRKY